MCAEVHAVDLRRRQTYSQRMDCRKVITIEPSKRGGKPCIRGLRITVFAKAFKGPHDALTDIEDADAASGTVPPELFARAKTLR